jgi:hypothetical protein
MTMKKVPAAAAGTFVFSVVLGVEMLIKLLELNGLLYVGRPA